MTRNDEDFRILVVDDNRELREILQEYLRDGGDIVEGAGDGKEALEKQKNSSYDLIITDLNMPEIPGMELIKTIKQENDVTEFVIITGYASVDSAVEAIKIGAFDYIVKPFRMEELKVVVRNVREKIRLKKLNAKLVETLKGFYGELDRYRQKAEDGTGKEQVDTPVATISGTEEIIKEIADLEKLRKGRLLID